MEPDISILRKTGHFYFALTRSEELMRQTQFTGEELQVKFLSDSRENALTY